MTAFVAVVAVATITSVVCAQPIRTAIIVIKAIEPIIITFEAAESIAVSVEATEPIIVAEAARLIDVAAAETGVIVTEIARRAGARIPITIVVAVARLARHRHEAERHDRSRD